ncbi:RluA family pseudouridine synthase [Candidatus Parcubacteria bacterium]|uniref:Pseudouridine synthase n=1 Tax=Candidatus Kaiserbacteria bacterium CG10_big_fil_rev_8_21_14_0_10_47_16 TaxID=1974608 RepID=A0A2H0UEM6_9BACT|nr:RluA family pseudouridine synthase [Candidatus Parcubacteria bacterium]PIR84874.1 MAG: RNA pseudouridine synthase [Candidatus Kaiserbacteria bacterium CG10_big_fil_rev_8_21_14_0_10_47_16]
MNTIEIIYEDADVLVINKPVGILAHADGHSKEETVADWFVARVPEAAGVGEEQTLVGGTVITRPGIVHRLDKDTSGVMILAKTQAAFAYLKRQFHDRQVEKEYRAFVYGNMKEKWGSIDRPIGRSVKDFRLRSSERGARGVLRAAVTDWECIVQNTKYAYLKLSPKTGRTHQLRVHLKAISRPIVGDTLYATEVLLASDNLGFTSLALHAHTLTLTLPRGLRQTFTAPIPEAFIAAEAAIAK